MRPRGSYPISFSEKEEIAEKQAFIMAIELAFGSDAVESVFRVVYLGKEWK